MDGVPQFRRPQTLLDDAGDPWLREQMAFSKAEPPDEFTTHCREHALQFSRAAVLDWAMHARDEVLDAERTGGTPRKTKRNLYPRAMQ